MLVLTGVADIIYSMLITVLLQKCAKANISQVLELTTPKLFH